MKRIKYSLLQKFPELCLEWSKKNIKSPKEYSYGSSQKVWWKCKICSYEWEATVANRAGSNRGCPLCAKPSRIVSNNNRLSIIYPDIAKEWNYIKNNSLTPDDIQYGSSKKVWWNCLICNNIYLASCHARTGHTKTACPNCKKSKGEKSIENYLKQYSIPYKTEYQFTDCKNIFPLRFDFAIWINNQLKLIEYNGEQHYKITGYYLNQDKLIRTIKNDKIKLDYCINNDIPFLIIKYSDKNINLILKNFIKI